MTEHAIGVDISKSHLDAFRLEDGAALRECGRGNWRPEQMAWQDPRGADRVRADRSISQGVRSGAR